MGYAYATFSALVTKTMTERLEDITQWAQLPADTKVVEITRFDDPALIGAAVLLQSDSFAAATPDDAFRARGLSLEMKS